MDERTHFYSVVASVLHSASPEEKDKITLIFLRDEPIQAEDVIRQLVAIVGKQRVREVITALAEVDDNGPITQ